MEKLYYNKVDKELVILFGYGIGNHLSVNFLKSYLKEIKKLVPQISQQKLNNINFLQVALSSRRHRYMWYCRISVDLTAEMEKSSFNDGHNFKLGDKSVYAVEGNCLEKAADCINRLIHD
jgi:hypothetical protein